MKQTDQIHQNMWKFKRLFEKYKFLLLVAGVGVFLLLLPGRSSQVTASEAASNLLQRTDFSVETAEEKIEQALSKVAGTGRVHVALTLKDDGERFFLQNEKSNRKLGSGDETEQNTEQETVIVSRGSGMQEPVIIGQDYPRYQGAVVVCEGGGDVSICLELTEAVSSLTGLGADQITILKMESEE